jgi:hypothetical protein
MAAAMPWFLRQPLKGGATVVEIAWATVALAGATIAPVGGIQEQSSGTTYLSTDVPEADFTAMMQRAARHEGYKGRQRDLRETFSGDVTLSYCASAGGSSSPPSATCERRTLCDVAEIPGTPLIVRTYRRERLACTAYPCDAEPDATMRSRRFELRVHARSTLLFEVKEPYGASAGANQTRAVRLEIDVEPRGGAKDRVDAEWDDLRRTTENTIQNVFLGMKPRRPPRVS